MKCIVGRKRKRKEVCCLTTLCRKDAFWAFLVSLSLPSPALSDSSGHVDCLLGKHGVVFHFFVCYFPVRIWMWNHVAITTIYLHVWHFGPGFMTLWNLYKVVLHWGRSVTARRDLRYIAELCFLSKLDFFSNERWGIKQSLPNVLLLWVCLLPCLLLRSISPIPAQKEITPPWSCFHQVFTRKSTSDLPSSGTLMCFSWAKDRCCQTDPYPVSPNHWASIGEDRCLRCIMYNICLTVFYPDFCFEDWWGNPDNQDFWPMKTKLKPYSEPNDFLLLLAVLAIKHRFLCMLAKHLPSKPCSGPP